MIFSFSDITLIPFSEKDCRREIVSTVQQPSVFYSLINFKDKIPTT